MKERERGMPSFGMFVPASCLACGPVMYFSRLAGEAEQKRGSCEEESAASTQGSESSTAGSEINSADRVTDGEEMYVDPGGQESILWPSNSCKETIV